MNYQQNLQLWLNAKIDPKIKKEITNMDQLTQKEAFFTHIAWGTAGIRGIRGWGTNRINIYNIRMYSLAYGKYLLQNTKAIDTGVAIAYDNRHMSKEFSYEAAKVFGALDIKTYIFKEPRPTPQLSWTIRHMNLAGGLVLTASHNPPEYNGYKIYDDEGCQIAQEKFEIFAKHLQEVGYDFNVKTLSIANLKIQGLLEYLDDTIDQKYVDAVKIVQVNPVQNQKINVIYSSQHGAAGVVTKNLFDSLGLKLDMVKEHIPIDSDFTYAPFPNPEDSKAYELLIRDGKKLKADLIMSTDPDGDRFGCGVLHNGKYRLLNGNETAALILEYILSNKMQNNTLGQNPYAIFSNVTGMLGKDICDAYGVVMHETLTGFKWIGSVYNKELQKGFSNFIVGYEESYGFLLSDVGRDKDSLQAGLLLYEMTEFYKSKGLSLVDQLEKIYQKYGYRIEYTKSLVLQGSKGMAKINEVMQFFTKSSYNKIFQDGIVKIINYKNQTSYTDRDQNKITIPSHLCIKLFFNQNNWLAIRPSGTEPKLKFYLSLKGNTKQELKDYHHKVLNYINNILNKFKIKQ